MEFQSVSIFHSSLAANPLVSPSCMTHPSASDKSSPGGHKDNHMQQVTASLKLAQNTCS